MELRKARRLAAEVAEYMQPYCHRVQQAGSLRREKLEVGDLELVLIPKWEPRPAPGDLFGGEIMVNALWTAMQPPKTDDIHIEWIKPGIEEIVPWHIKPDGKYWRGLIAGADGNGPLQPIKLDVFIARPENYGVIFAIRTGSADFSRALVTYARDHSRFDVEGGELRWKRSRIPEPCHSEQELFELLGLKFIEPRFRDSDKDVQPL